MESRKSYLTNKAFNSFLLASMFTMAAIQIGNTVDGMILSYLIGEKAMCAANICRPVVSGLFALCTLLGSGGTMLIGVAIGNHDRDEANHVFTDVVMAAVVLGLVLLLIGLVWLEPLTDLLCPDMSLRDVTSEYLSVTLYGAMFGLLSGMMAMLVAVDGSPNHVTLAVLLSALSNVAFDYLFIAVMGWGVLGAAWATQFSYLVSLFVLLPHFFRKEALRLAFSGCFSALPRCISIGLPLGIGAILAAVQMWGTNSIVVEYLGQNGVTALSVCMYMQCLSGIIVSGVMKAFQPVASILKGAGDNHGVTLVIRKVYLFLAAGLCLFVVPMVFYPREIGIAFAVTESAALGTTVDALVAFAANIFLFCMIYPLITIYQLYGNKRAALFISVSQSMLPMLGMLVLAAISVDDIWWGLALGMVIAGCAGGSYSAVKRERNNKLARITLVPQNETLDGFETSIVPELRAMSKLLDETDAFLKTRVDDSLVVLGIEVSTEELLKNIITYGYVKQGKRRYIDYRLSIMPGHVCVVISDDARAFNPIGHSSKTGYGLKLLHGFCKEMKYEYLFHQNIVKMVFPCKTA